MTPEHEHNPEGAKPKRQMLEVAPGRLKPESLCSPAERRRAVRILGQSNELLSRHGALLKRVQELAISEGGINFWADALPLTLSVLATGEFPEHVTLPVLEGEVRELERILDGLGDGG